MTNTRRLPLRKRSGSRRLLAFTLLIAAAVGTVAPTGAAARGVAPSTVLTPDGHRYVYFRTSTGQLGAWVVPASGAPNQLTWGYADSVQSDVSAVRVSNGDRYVYFRRPNGQLGIWKHFADGVNWDELEAGLANTVAGSPSAVVASNGDRYVYFRRPNGQLGIWRFFADGVNWQESSVGYAGSVVGDPAAVVASNGDRYVYFRTSNGQLGAWKFFADNVNLNYTASGNAGEVAGNPKPAISPNGNRFISFRTATGKLGLWWFAPDGVNWNYTTWGTTGNLLDDPAPSFAPSGEYFAYYRRANGQLGVLKFPVSGPPSDDGAGYSGLVAGSPSLVVAGDGARFVYYTRTNGQLGGWWFGAASGWNSGELGLPGSLPALDDQYTTSWDFGGGNVIIDSSDEADAVIDAIRGGSDSNANALRTGLTSADVTYVTARVDAASPASRTYGGPNWKVDSPAEADAVIAAGAQEGLALEDADYVANRQAPAPSAQALAQVDQAVASGSSAVQQLADQAATNPDLAGALLKKATVTLSTGNATAQPRRVAPGCHGTNVTAKTAVGFPGVTLAWRSATVTAWCWNSNMLTTWGLDHSEWTAPGYCWKAEGQNSSWLISPTRRRYRNWGTLTTGVSWGCIGAQQTLSPSVHFERGGGWNVYRKEDR